MTITFYLIVPFVTWAITQSIKFAINLVRGDGDLRYLYASGGMPSVHSAVVCSLATWSFIEGGVNSPLFGITTVFAGIVMYDSFGVRRSAGEQARELNKLIGELTTSGNLKNADGYSKLREILGHKPLEVLVGATLGVIIAAIFGYAKLSTQYPQFFTIPGSQAAKIILAVGVALVIISPIVAFVALRKYKRQKNARSGLLYVSFATAISGVLIVLLGMLAYEKVYVNFAQWWVIGFVALFSVAVIGLFIMHFLKTLQTTDNKQDLAATRKALWLKRSKKRK